MLLPHVHLFFGRRQPVEWTKIDHVPWYGPIASSPGAWKISGKSGCGLVHQSDFGVDGMSSAELLSNET